MDVSKLPKLSDSRAAEPPATPVEAVRVAAVPVEAVPVAVEYRARATPPPGVGVGVWISTVVGLLCLSLGIGFAKFAVAKVTHRPFDTGFLWPDDDPNGRAGQPVAYFDLQGHTAWTEMGLFLFGLTLLLEAASSAAVGLRPGPASRGLLTLAIGLTVATLALNLIACGLVLGDGATPITSGLAVAFGGWVLFDEISAWSTTRPVAVAGYSAGSRVAK